MGWESWHVQSFEERAREREEGEELDREVELDTCGLVAVYDLFIKLVKSVHRTKPQHHHDKRRTFGAVIATLKSLVIPHLPTVGPTQMTRLSRGNLNKESEN